MLIRTANLISITEADVARLVDELGVRRVIDLRTDVEVPKSGPGPLTQVGAVDRSISCRSTPTTGRSQAKHPDAVVPWAGERFDSDRDPQVAVLPALPATGGRIPSWPRCGRSPSRTAPPSCTAPPARTAPAMIVALALSLVGVPREVIAADYAHTQSQIAAILEQLARVDLYNHETTRPDDSSARLGREDAGRARGDRP